MDLIYYAVVLTDNNSYKSDGLTEIGGRQDIEDEESVAVRALARVG